MTYTKLTKPQLKKKINYIHQYTHSDNSANGSKLDANANVDTKNIATLRDELNKDITIQVNREILRQKIEEIYGEELAVEYIRQLEMHEIYTHDESNLAPYCVSISMYPFLVDGLTTLGGVSDAPKNIYGYCGNFVNLIFAVSSQFSGAVATVEFLLHFDYFAKKEWGDDYLSTHEREIQQLLQGVVYSLNQPAAARGYQCPFWNISVYDEGYFNGMFDSFYYPNGDKAEYKTLATLQEYFLEWFRLENEKKLLTFPVITSAYLNDGEKPVDLEFENVMINNLSKGGTFFKYTSENPDSLSSCCRLRNEFSDNTFSNSSGAGGVSTGSINVITLNMNRLIQDGRCVKTESEKILKYQIAYRNLMEELLNDGMLPVYDAGYIRLDKQFSTIGISGLVEGAESMGVSPLPTDQYEEYMKNTLGVIKKVCKDYREEHGIMFNIEQVPAENLAIKFASWDKEDNYKMKRDCYSSYMYAPECEQTTIIDKIKLHGDQFTKYCDGGSALHLNLDNHPDKEQYKKLIRSMITEKVPYWCENIRRSKCNDCGHIEIKPVNSCEKCGSENIVHGQRIVGYIKWSDSYSEGRQTEANERHYH